MSIAYQKQYHALRCLRRICTFLLIGSIFISFLIACQYQKESARTVAPPDKEKEAVQVSTDSIIKTSGNDIQSERKDSLPKAENMTKAETYNQLPKDYDIRLTHILAEPLADNVIVSFYYVAVSKNPGANYRWELHDDGRLFVTYHSGKNLSSEVIFDKPLPKKPTKILSKNDLDDLYAQLEKSKFFRQPEFQKIFVEGGSYVILRARSDNNVHEVVYENVENSLIKYLYLVTE